MSAHLIGVDDKVTDIGHEPTLKEAQAMVGGYVEVLLLHVGRKVEQLLFNEDGRRLELEYNSAASTLARRNIVGPAIHLTGREKWK